MKYTEAKQGNEPVCPHRTANFGLTSPTNQSGPSLEVVLNIPAGLDWNRPFPLTFDRNYQNFWHNGAPVVSLLVRFNPE